MVVQACLKENNYKDLAIQSRKEAIVMVEESYQNKQLSDKKYGEYKTLLETYTQLMKNYNHQEFYHSQIKDNDINFV